MYPFWLYPVKYFLHKKRRLSVRHEDKFCGNTSAFEEEICSFFCKTDFFHIKDDACMMTKDKISLKVILMKFSLLLLWT